MMYTHNKLGETTILFQNLDIVPVYCKWIPAIDEIGISLEMGEAFDCWIDLMHADYENVYEIECCFTNLAEGQAEALLTRLKEWAK